MIFHVTHSSPNTEYSYRALIFFIIKFLPKSNQQLTFGLTFLYFSFEFCVFFYMVSTKIAQVLGIRVLKSAPSVIEKGKELAKVKASK